MDWTTEERRLLDRGGWVAWLGSAFVLIGLGLVAGFVGTVIASDEAFAARPFYGASLALLGAGTAVFAAGVARSAHSYLRARVTDRR